MTIDLVFITYNRLEYTKLALASVLADHSEEFSLTIWDNASSDGTVEYLKNEVADARISEIVFSRTNIGQTATANKIWSRSHADLLGKVDNDCLVTPGWTRILAQAHNDIENLGVIACWHFFPEDFDYERAKHKIATFGKHKVLRHPWTCGTGFLIKREAFQRYGPIGRSATTQYFLNLAKAGYVNGFYYPLVYQEHMDDPRSKHNRLKNMTFEEAYKDTYGYQVGVIKDLQGYERLHKEILDNLLSGPYNPRYYIGWRAKLRRTINRITKTVKKI
jgi:GT2 family glycosyltransferase